ncbi:hypothetical protein [Moorena bouillonii]|nr:hypothetical protein [Moorena bouillonii]
MRKTLKTLPRGAKSYPESATPSLPDSRFPIPDSLLPLACCLS